MEIVFERCPTDPRLRRTLAECLADNRDASTLFRRHPATVVRAAEAALRKAASRAS